MDIEFAHAVTSLPKLRVRSPSLLSGADESLLRPVLVAAQRDAGDFFVVYPRTRPLR
jgi:hypothetical protein